MKMWAWSKFSRSHITGWWVGFGKALSSTAHTFKYGIWKFTPNSRWRWVCHSFFGGVQNYFLKIKWVTPQWLCPSLQTVNSPDSQNCHQCRSGRPHCSVGSKTETYQGEKQWRSETDRRSCWKVSAWQTNSAALSWADWTLIAVDWLQVWTERRQVCGGGRRKVSPVDRSSFLYPQL